MTNEEFIKSISLEGEEWRDVAGFEGRYKVSSLGRIVTLGHRIDNPPRHTKPSVMKPYFTKKGYLQVDLSSGTHDSRIAKRLHRLIADAFIQNPEKLPEIDHIDTDKTNNAVYNLRWCSAKTNSENHISKEKKRLSHIGKLNSSSSRPIVCMKNGELIKTYPSIAEAVRCGYSKSSILYNIKGVYSHHRGFQWMYLSDYKSNINKQQDS